MAIKSFSDKATEKFFSSGGVGKGVGWTSIKKVVARKLDMIQAAVKLSDLKAPPSNHLEELKGDLAGSHSIRVNDQWRIVFKWTDAGPVGVRVVDYH